MGWLTDLFSGSSEQTQTGTQSVTPWEPVSGALTQLAGGIKAPQGLTGGEASAINQWGNIGKKGHQFTGAYDGVARGLLTPTDYGGYAKDAYADMQGNLGGYASGAMLDPQNNPYFAGLMTQLGDQAAQRTNAQFAAAGRDLSGANMSAVGRGVTEAQLPVLANMYQQNQDRQFQANSMLQGAGYGLSGLLSDLDTAEGNRQLAGIQAGNSAMDARLWGPQQMLASEGARRGIPLQSQTAYSGLLGDLASRFGTQNQSSTATTESSPSVMDMIGQVVGIGGTLLGMPGLGGGGSGAPASGGTSYMPSFFQGGGYSPYGGQNNPYAGYAAAGKTGANPYYLGAY
jgi:hypothetical protein